MDGEGRPPRKEGNVKNIRFLTTSLYVFGFLDLFAVALIIPVASRQATNLGASPAAVGLVGTIYGTLQLISAPLVGRWSDVGGRRLTLLLCLFFTSVGYILMGLSTSIVYYLLARVPLGIFKHSVSITRAYLAEITPKSERARVFGYFNGISSIGFIIGPLIGGHLAEMDNGFFKVSLITSALFALWFVFVLLFMTEPEHRGLPNTKSVQDFTADEFGSKFHSSLHTFKEIIKSGPELFFIRFLQGFSATLFRSNFTLMLEQKFDSTPIITGRIISFGSLASALCAIGVGRLVKIYRNLPRLYFHACTLRIFAIVLIIFAPSIPSFLVFYFLLSMGNSVARVCSTNLSIERGKVEDTGALLGLNQSVMSVCRTVSPLIAGVSQEVTSEGPAILSVILSIGTAGLVATSVLEERKISDKEKKL
ncbi:major facilitator superfamily domain-containing protein 9-like [Lytechinus variegatus]|uniref:major facilitator superfamily domain-containing protein 9-like n=1 Tax=Lytechinus variegatus TaxID=7654 RepID=UPI001BB1A4A9|nr:major facilitator superfamily domain-containing protein 9-like [Lytechinus variegatus]